MKKYFAYGTLMDAEEMQAFAPSAVVDDVLRLDGYEMGFGETCRKGKGGCRLIRKQDAVTYGVHYSLSNEDMERMDIASGVPDGLWEHLEIEAIDSQGRRVRTITYTIPGDPPEFQPGAEYTGKILKGIEKLKLPGEYVTRVKDIINRARTSR